VAAVTVLEKPCLLINGKTDATTGVGEDMALQVSVGQMPLLLTDGKDAPWSDTEVASTRAPS
jgi:hypothetical protein